MPSPADTPLPQVVIAPDAEDPRAAFADMVRDVFEVTPLHSATAADTRVSVWHLGATMIGTFAGPPTTFIRDAALVAASGLDQFLVQLYTAGGFAGVAGEAPITVAAGDICIFDLAETLCTTASAYANISILVPRTALLAGRDAAGLHGLVIPGDRGPGALLGEHLRTLVERVEGLRGDEAALATTMTFALIAAAARSLARKRPPTRRPATSRDTPLRRALDHIDAHIGDPLLDVERIAAATGCSRAALFRLFGRLGGVERHIRRQRLAGAARDLADPARAHRIGDIAHRWGFASDAAFSRAFRRAYGMNPRTARSHNLAVLLGESRIETSASDADRQFVAWLRSLPAGIETLDQ